MQDTQTLSEAIQLIRNSKYLTAFTGAGISVESGIPPFRGEHGIWSKYDPGILDIDRYQTFPEETWSVIKELFYNYFGGAKPNAAHYFLAYLEKVGILKSVITQNIDNLHQEAGNTKVIEYHGNSKWLVCSVCGDRIPVDEKVIKGNVPHCSKDNGLMKPDFVFFGEAIPERAATRANREAERSDLLLVIGTTGEVMPASVVPRMAKNSGSRIIEINVHETVYTQSLTDLFLQGMAGEVCAELQSEFTQ
ncbi:MAG: Sir2 family NAD-dependent protein deacetylase [Bacteroidales bacterium]